MSDEEAIGQGQVTPETEPVTPTPTATTERVEPLNPPEPAEPEPYWPEDWREKAAERVSAGKEDVAEKELRRLQKMSDPAALYASYRSLEDMLASKQMIAKPGEDASDEDIDKFREAIGIPKDVTDYEINLQNGVVIGEEDAPLVAEFLNVAHEVGAPNESVNAVLNWYYDKRMQDSYELDESDVEFHSEALNELREEYGSTFNRLTNNISTLFTQAPGGTDVENENGLFTRLMGGRMADGKLVGDDPDMVRWLVSLSSEVNPAATVVDDAAGGIESIDEELSKISQLRRTDRRAYNKDADMQQRERDLLAAKEKIQARA